MRARALVVLVVSAVWLAACGGGGDKTVVKTVTAPPTQSTTAPPTTPTTPTTPPETTPHVAHPAGERRPQAVLPLALQQHRLRRRRRRRACDIRNRDWEPPPKPPSCELDYGQGISVGGSLRGEFVCAGDTALDPSFGVLPYGTDSRVGKFTCSSREDGMTCTNTSTNHGFSPTRDRYRLF